MTKMEKREVSNRKEIENLVNGVLIESPAIQVGDLRFSAGIKTDTICFMHKNEMGGFDKFALALPTREPYHAEAGTVKVIAKETRLETLAGVLRTVIWVAETLTGEKARLVDDK